MVSQKEIAVYHFPSCKCMLENDLNLFHIILPFVYLSWKGGNGVNKQL